MKKIDFTINENDLPEIKDWKVGSEYELSVKVKMTGFQKGEMYSGMDMPGSPSMKNGENKPAEAHFEITEVKVDDAEDAGDGKKQPFAQEYAGKRAKGAAMKDEMMNS